MWKPLYVDLYQKKSISRNKNAGGAEGQFDFTSTDVYTLDTFSILNTDP